MFKQDSIIQRIVRLITIEGAVTEQQVADTLGISVAEAEENLRALTALGYLNMSEDAPTEEAKEVERLRNKVAQLENTLALANAALRAGSQLINELSEGDECTAYIVSVDGADAPRVVHATVEAAREEAERIAAHKRNATIRILAVVDVLHVQTQETKSLDWERAPAEGGREESCDNSCEGCPNA